MSELEELPSWAGRSTGEQRPAEPAPQRVLSNNGPQPAPHPQEPPQRRGRMRMVLFGLLGVAALLGMGAVGYLLASSQDSNSTETAGQAESSDDTAELSSEADTSQSEADQEGADGDDATAEAGDEAGETVTVDTQDDADEADDQDDAAAEIDDTADTGGEADAAGDALPGSDSGRQAIFRGGKVYLIGPVPSEEVGLLIEGKAAAVVGPENVVNEYVIDPESVIEPGSSAPLYVEDVVLFEFNSVEVAQPFLPILDLGTLLLRQNPQASVTVVTRTDAVGSEAVNLDVATKRAQAVINYWLGKGVNADQINADPRGEEGASEDDDEQTAALNRRAEFIITGLLD